MKRKEGISLIVLVITIVVIVILATAVILSIANNNPIGNASEAVEKNNRAEYESELSLYIAKQYADKNGDYDPSTLNKQSDEVSEIITSLSEKDKDKYLILKGKLVENTKQNQVDVSFAVKKEDSDTQTELSPSKIQELCPSITEEEEAKEYIIWLGKLYKKEETSDGIRYVNSDGERAKFLDEETEVTESAVEFAKMAMETDLLYNGGYINVTGENNRCKYTVEDLQNYFSQEDITVLHKQNEITGDRKFSTDDEILYNGEVVAKTVLYGDTNCDGSVNATDMTPIRTLIQGRKVISSVYISGDLDHNGFIEYEDEKNIINIVGARYEIEWNVLPKRAKVILNE